MPRKWHTHLKWGRAKGGRETRGNCRVSKANERGTEMLSLYLWTPKWRLWATWSAIFFDEGLYSKWVCMQLYILIIKYLNLKKQKKKLKMKQIIKFIWSWRFVVFNPACLKKDQLDFRNLTDLCVCVCMCMSICLSL